MSRVRPLANGGRRNRQHQIRGRVSTTLLALSRELFCASPTSHSCSLHPDTCAMASIMRPSLMRQAVQAPAASQRMLSTVTSSTINRPLAQQLRPAFQRAAIPKSARIAAFHATQRNQILPPLPQKIIGTTNDPTPVPDPDYTHGSYHWSFERCVYPHAEENGRNRLDTIMSASRNEYS
jgi:hypothetical protein